MDPWELFCELTRRVVEDQNCVLDVHITKEGILMQLAPYEDWEDKEDEEGSPE